MPGPDANPARAGFDWRAFARTVRAACVADGRGLRAIAAEIGVTASDLSRAQGGTNIDAGKVMAICDWAGVNERTFYLPPEKEDAISERCTARPVKHPERAHVTPKASRKSSDQGEKERAHVRPKASRKSSDQGEKERAHVTPKASRKSSDQGEKERAHVTPKASRKSSGQESTEVAR